MNKIVLSVVLLFFAGCTVRILTFGSESSNTDKEYNLGYKNEGVKDGKE